MENNNLDAILTIRILREEKGRILKHAILEGLQMSGFVRHIVIDYINKKEKEEIR